jgi:hypothetical protein
MRMVRFEDLTLERVIFEARYRDGYLYWDNSGKIWRSLSQIWPDLTLQNVTTQQATFQLGSAGIDLFFSHERFAANQDYPNKLDFYKEFMEKSSQIVFESLQVSSFLRVGNRYQYILKVNDKNEATEFFKSKSLLNLPERVSGLGKNITEPAIKFVVERDDISITVRLGFESRNLEFSVPRPLKVDTSAFIKEYIAVDIDSFSTKVVDRGTFSVEEFIATHERNTRRLVERLLT